MTPTTVTPHSPPGNWLAPAIRAEWVKLRTMRSTWCALLAAMVLLVAVCVVVALSVHASATNGYDISTSAAQVATDAVRLAQLPFVVLAALSITGEYAAGTIGTTLRAVPLRGRILLAKTIVVATVAFAGGLVLAALGTAVSAAVLGSYADFTVVEAVRTASSVAGYLALVGVMVVGVGTAARTTAGTVLGVVLLLLAVPTVMELSGLAWLLDARDYLPSTAGDALMSDDPEQYSAGTAVLVLSAWGLIAQLVGYATLWTRDA